MQSGFVNAAHLRRGGLRQLHEIWFDPASYPGADIKVKHRSERLRSTYNKAILRKLQWPTNGFVIYLTECAFTFTFASRKFPPIFVMLHIVCDSNALIVLTWVQTTTAPAFSSHSLERSQARHDCSRGSEPVTSIGYNFRTHSLLLYDVISDVRFTNLLR